MSEPPEPTADLEEPRRPLPPRGRRGFLKLGVVSAALLAAGGGVAAWLGSGYAALLGPGEVPIALSVKELAVVRALCEALFPADGAFPSALAIGLPQRIDEEAWAASDRTRKQLAEGLQVLEHVPWLFGHWNRFTALAPAARLDVFGALLRSRQATLRQIGVALKQLTHLYYFAHPAVWKAIHYDGPLVETPVPPASHVEYEALLAERRRA